MRSNPGKAWELALDQLHLDYDRQGLAKIERGHPPVRVLSPVRGGRFDASWAGDGALDFGGTLAGGRSVVFEAKYTADSRFGLAQIEPHQARRLERHRRLGAVAGIALRTPAGERWLSWDVLVERYRLTPSGSVDPRDYPEFDVRGEGWLPLVDAARVAA